MVNVFGTFILGYRKAGGERPEAGGNQISSGLMPPVSGLIRLINFQIVRVIFNRFTDLPQSTDA